MTLLAKGFNEELDQQWWATVAPAAGTPYQIIEGLEYLTNRTSAREGKIRAGSVLIHGVLVTLTQDTVFALDRVTSGTRWDTLVIRVTWQTRSAELVVLQGSSTPRVPLSIKNTPGVVFDMPLLLCRADVGQDEITDRRDLRVFPSKVIIANDLRGLPALTGGLARVNGIEYAYDSRSTDPYVALRWIPTQPTWRAVRLFGERAHQTPGLTPQWKISGDRVDVRGRIRRTTGTMGPSDNGWSLGYLDGITAEGFCVVPCGGRSAFARVLAIPEGGNTRLLAHPDDEVSYVDLGGLTLWVL